MKKIIFLFLLVLLIYPSTKSLANTLNVSIENPDVNRTTNIYSFDVYLERTDEWSPAPTTNAIGSYDFFFHFNWVGLANPRATVTPGGPFDNVNYNLIYALYSGNRFYVLNNYNYVNSSLVPLPLNVKVKAFTVTIDIINIFETSGLTWDEVNSGGATQTEEPIVASYSAGNDAELPVELSSFSGIASKNGIDLNWQTATEVNNYGFDVERSLTIADQTSNKWEKISFVEGSGNSNSQKDYNFTDKTVTTGNYSYRLRQVDIDGKFDYSNIIEVNFENIPTEYGLSQNYPNPFNPSTTISYSIPQNVKSEVANVSLIVYDILGNEVATLVNEQKAPGNYEVNFDAVGLSSGLYFYKIESGSFTLVKKMMLLK